MKELKTLSQIVTRSCNLTNVLPVQDNKNSKESLLLEGIISNKFKDDNEAAKNLYESNPNDVRYKMLKYRVKRKLYNGLLFIDFSRTKTKEFYKKEHECLHLLHQSQILTRQLEHDLALALAGKAVLIAAEYEFLNYLIAAYELIVFCYSEKGDLKNYKMNQEKLDEALIKKRYEREAVTILQYTKVSLKKTVKLRRELLPLIPDNIKELERLWLKAKTFDSFNAYYKVAMLYYEMIGDFDAIADLTMQSETWLHEGRLNKHRFEPIYNKFILVYALLRAKKYEDGLEFAKKYVSNFEPSSLNWFSFMENYFLLALHNKNFELGNILLHKVLISPYFANISSVAKERWRLYQAYFFQIAPFSSDSTNTNPFLLSLPEYSKDKQGFNVAILILQFVYFLQKKDSEALLYRIETLKKYVLTHLKDTFSTRSKIFLKLLILTVTEDFDTVACQKKGQKLYQKLIETPTPGDAYAEIEIVPYEQLWEHILSVLESHS